MFFRIEPRSECREGERAVECICMERVHCCSTFRRKTHGKIRQTFSMTDFNDFPSLRIGRVTIEKIVKNVPLNKRNHPTRVNKWEKSEFTRNNQNDVLCAHMKTAASRSSVSSASLWFSHLLSIPALSHYFFIL